MNASPLPDCLEGLLPPDLADKYRILGHMKFDGKQLESTEVHPDHKDLVSNMSSQTHSAYLAYDKVRSECISVLCGVCVLRLCATQYWRVMALTHVGIRGSHRFCLYIVLKP